MPRKRVADMTEEEREAQRAIWRASKRARYAAAPALVHDARDRQHYRRRYGLTPRDYDRLLAAQGNRCEICGTPVEPGKRLHVDHDHETGKVRGLLCGNCNRGLGLYKDSPVYLANAITYLEKSRVRAPGNL